MPPTRPPYPPQFRAEAVRLVKESGKSIDEIAKDLGVSHQTLRNWVRQAEIDAGLREGLATAEREELAVKTASCERSGRSEKSRGLLRQRERPDPIGAFRFVECERAHHAVSTVCRVLEVSASG